MKPSKPIMKKKGVKTPISIQPKYDFNDDWHMRPRNIVNLKTNALIAFAIFVGCLIVYWITQNRSVTFWDVGEYITCSSILGIPHPPGNPFYIILGRFFTIIGLNVHHALIVNSLSGIMAALAVMFVYLFTVKLVSMIDDNKYLIIIAGLIAAFYTAFSYTFWNNAVEASVYPGRDLIINFVIWLTLVWVQKTKDYSHQNYLLLIVYAFFIGFSIHQTSLQILPAVFFIVIYPILMHTIKTSKFWIRFTVFLIIGLILYFVFIPIADKLHVPDMAKIVTALFFGFISYFYLKDRIPIKVWIWGIIFTIIALSPHIYLFVRSELRPFINEGYPHNLELFSDYVLRRQYGVTSFVERRASFFYQLDFHFLRYFFWQFFHVETISRWLSIPPQFIVNLAKLIVLSLGFGGIYYHYKRNKHSFIYLLAFFLMTSLAMIFVMNLSDAEVRDRDYFFVSAYYLWAVWMAIGSIGLIRYFNYNRKKLLPILSVLVILLPIFNFASQYFIHDRSREFIALDYGLNFLNGLEENAIIFTHGDNDTFPLWYAQAVYDPYAFEHIYPARHVYPDKATERAISEAMEYKRSHLKGIRPDVSVANLSLLNTPWYIRQLRDLEGIQFTMPDEHIDGLRPFRLESSRQISINSPNPEDSFTVAMERERVFFIKDLSAIRIIQDNYGKRPIYFAVTIADNIIFDDHLRNEGMVKRLVPTKDRDQIDLERLKNNLENVYSYRSIFEEDIYKDENMQKLITNYGAAFMRLSEYYHQRDDLSNAAHYLEKAVRFVRDQKRFSPALIQMFLDAEEYDRAMAVIDNTLREDPKSLTPYIQAAFIHLENDSVEAAYAMFDRAVQAGLFSEELVSFIYIASVDYELYDQGIEALEKLRKRDSQGIVPEYIEMLQVLQDTLRDQR
ncbi:MAG: DUF2723 domain-containing protein [Candidatus Cloacimonetes bacterium]|nr:DUF2723 domain-containing protein [Candidatus Cloacimonadota bacterium]